MKRHINYQATLSKEAVELFIKLTEVAEMIHHQQISRAEIYERMAAMDRELVNTCHEDLLQIREAHKEVKL